MKVYDLKDREVAGKNASRLKNKSDVKAYINEECEKISRMAKVDAKEVISLLADIAFTSPAEFASISEEGGKQKIVWKDVDKLPEDVKRAIATIKNTPSGILIETLDRLKAIDLLMKHMGISRSGQGGVYFEGENELE